MINLIIAVDFDGTIVNHIYPKIGREIDNAFYYLKRLRDDGHKLIMWTCREGRQLDEAVKHCMRNGVIFDAVNNNINDLGDNLAVSKIYADIYVDDKNFDTIINWAHIYSRISQLCGRKN